MVSFDTVEQFEILIADYFGAKYGIATDSCTHAIELSLRYDLIQISSCPRHTYLSIPMTLSKLGIDWSWSSDKWSLYYFLGNSRVVDAAVLWQENSYISGTLMCLSFQFKKHLPIGRGGMILTDNCTEYEILKSMSYDGRDTSLPWAEQDIKQLGYHYYMTPESAEYGINQFYNVKDIVPRKRDYRNYPDISNMSVFNNGS